MSRRRSRRARTRERRRLSRGSREWTPWRRAARHRPRTSREGEWRAGRSSRCCRPFIVAARSLESWHCLEKNRARDFSPDAHGNAVMKVGSSDTPPPALRRARTAFGGDVRRELEAASMPNHSRDDGTCSEAQTLHTSGPRQAVCGCFRPRPPPRACSRRRRNHRERSSHLPTRVRERARVVLSTASSSSDAHED